MDERALAFLKRLLDAPGPSGYEARPARTWKAEAESFGAAVSVDVGGNTFATINRGGSPRVMLTGHLDEIGVMVTHIDEDGFLYFAGIGGWDSQVLVGHRVVLDGSGSQVMGVIGKKAIHLMKTEERDKVSKITDLWIDIGVKNKAEAQEKVRVGDSGVIATSLVEFPGGRIASRSIDNRMGSWVALEALRRIAAGPKVAAEVVAVGTTQEEISYGGGGARNSAYFVEPAAAIVVDVTHATDFPGADKKEQGDFKLGGGVVLSRGSSVSPVMFRQLVDAAEAEKIPYGVEAAPRGTSTDADGIFNVRHGIATALVSVPCRYMHSPNEMVALEDLDHAADLLAAWVRRLTSDTSFIPH